MSFFTLLKLFVFPIKLQSILYFSYQLSSLCLYLKPGTGTYRKGGSWFCLAGDSVIISQYYNFFQYFYGFLQIYIDICDQLENKAKIFNLWLRKGKITHLFVFSWEMVWPICFHPLSSPLIHFHPHLSTFVYFHPLSSTLIHFEPGGKGNGLSG